MMGDWNMYPMDYQVMGYLTIDYDAIGYRTLGNQPMGSFLVRYNLLFFLLLINVFFFTYRI